MQNYSRLLKIGQILPFLTTPPEPLKYKNPEIYTINLSMALKILNTKFEKNYRILFKTFNINFSIVNEWYATDDDGRGLIAIGYTSHSGDIKNETCPGTVFFYWLCDCSNVFSKRSDLDEQGSLSQELSQQMKIVQQSTIPIKRKTHIYLR